MTRMAMTMKAEGLEELERALNEAGTAAGAIAAAALYEGAGVMADEINQSVQGIQTEKFRYRAGGLKRLPSPEEKAVLKQARAGISRFRRGESVDTSVGFSRSGYGTINGKTVPVPVIANAINSGTSFMREQPFFRRAVAGATPKATAAIAAKGEEMAEQILNK